jgi:hypothetical protein
MVRRGSAKRRRYLNSPVARGGRVMIEFILIVVVLLLLIGIFVRREVFK